MLPRWNSVKGKSNEYEKAFHVAYSSELDGDLILLV